MRPPLSDEKRPDDDVRNRVGSSALLLLQMLARHVFVTAVCALEVDGGKEGRQYLVLQDRCILQCRRRQWRGLFRMDWT